MLRQEDWDWPRIQGEKSARFSPLIFQISYIYYGVYTYVNMKQGRVMNPSIWKVEAEESGVQNQPVLHKILLHTLLVFSRGWDRDRL